MSDRPHATEIPGTFVFDGRRASRGYQLNKLCMSLNDPANRVAFREDSEAYMDRFGVSGAQRLAVRNRDWLQMLELGGNIYFTLKIAIADGLTMPDVAAQMKGVTVDAFKRLMLDGGATDSEPAVG